MPIPAYHQMVTAAAAGSGAPFPAIECPSDDAPIEAADVRRVAAVALANDAYIMSRGVRSVLQYAATTVGFAPIATKSGPGTDYPTEEPGIPAILVDVPDTIAGSVLLIDVTAYVRTGVAASSSGLLGVRVIEDHAGVASAVDVVGCFGEWDADNQRRKEILTARHIISAPGIARVRLRLAGTTGPVTSTIEGYVTIRVAHLLSSA